MKPLARLLQTVCLSAFIILLLGCNNEPQLSSIDIQATVTSEVQNQLAIEATVQARLKEELEAITPSPTATPTITPTPTATPTITPIPTITPTATPFPTATPTPLPTATPTLVPTLTPPPTPTLPPKPPPTLTPIPTLPPSLSSLVSEVIPGVIRVLTNVSSGSGFVYSFDQTDGSIEIVTNHHVIEGASSISVRNDLGMQLNATVKGSNPILDIALLSVSYTHLTLQTILLV